MNKPKHFQRKSTYTSSNQSDLHLNLHSKNDRPRISTLKSLPFRSFSFSQHIFGEDASTSLQPESPTTFQSQKWIFKQSNTHQQKNQQIVKPKSENQNPFALAVLTYAKKGNRQQAIESEKKLIGDEINNSDIFEEVTTYRLIKKKSKTQLSQECFDILI